MLVSQVGAYHIARAYGSEWLSRTVPPFFYNPILAILCFLKNLIWTWTLSHNQYEKTQWTLAQEFHGSIVLYSVLLPAMRLILSWRLLLLALCAIWFFRQGNPIFLYPFGGVLAELSGLSYSTIRRDQMSAMTRRAIQLARRFLVILLLIAALYLGSFPGENPEWSEWSSFLLQFSEKNFPTFMPTRSWSGIAAMAIMVAIWLSSTMQRLLSGQVIVWLGDISFGCFLLHGILLRTLLVWIMVFSDQLGSNIASPLKVVGIIAWWFVLVFAAQNWRVHIERRIMKFIDNELKERLFLPLTGL